MEKWWSDSAINYLATRNLRIPFIDLNFYSEMTFLCLDSGAHVYIFKRIFFIKIMIFNCNSDKKYKDLQGDCLLFLCQSYTKNKIIKRNLSKE